jgi:hypothetical protein
VVDPDTNCGRLVPAKEVVGDAEAEANGVAGVRYPNHQCVANRLQVLGPYRRKLGFEASANRSTSATASSSPWASVRAVKPAMSANRNAADVSLPTVQKVVV